MPRTYTSNPAIMRAIHAYNRANHRQTNAQMRQSGSDGWNGCIVVNDDGWKWTIRIANGETYDVPSSHIRMDQA